MFIHPKPNNPHKEVKIWHVQEYPASLHDDEFRVRTTRLDGEEIRLAARRLDLPPAVLMRMMITAVLHKNQKAIDGLIESLINDDCF